jgi:hypothetical protein
MDSNQTVREVLAYQCAGCGNPADKAGATACSCPTTVLFRPRDNHCIGKVSAIDERIADYMDRISALKLERKETLAAIRAALKAQDHQP